MNSFTMLINLIEGISARMGTTIDDVDLQTGLGQLPGNYSTRKASTHNQNLVQYHQDLTNEEQI